MNKDINIALNNLVPALNSSGQNVKSIETVKNYYGANGREYVKEVAEITYQNGTRKYADIGCDSNLAALYDVLATLIGKKKESERIERVERNVYEMP